MLKITCPTCGHHMGHVPEPDKVRGRISPQEAVLFDALLADCGEGITYLGMASCLHEKISDLVKSTEVAKTVFHRMKAKIEPFGYFVKSHKNGGRENRYSIIPSEYPS